MSSSKYFKTSFKMDWLNDSSLSFWIAPCPSDNYSFYCKLCKRSVSLSNMGKQAVTSHRKSKKHEAAEKGRASSFGIGTFLKPKASLGEAVNIEKNQSPSILPSSESFNEGHHIIRNSRPIETVTSSAKLSIEKASTIQRGLNTFLEKENRVKAEILWCLISVQSHISMNAAGKCASIFKLMFPDSSIASNMQLGRAKLTYTIVYGLGPYFEKQLKEDIDINECYGISFDESLNKISQKQQMDFNIFYWSKKQKEMRVRYLGSAFLGHTKAEDLLNAFKNQLSLLNLNPRKLIHISMDGPNVNIKFLRLLKEFLKAEYEIDEVLLEVGTCGLHNLHNAFKTAIKTTEWKIVDFLRAIYNVFKNVPARRADYMRASGTESNKMPKKFCAIRWLENIEVAERAIQILKNLKEYVNTVHTDKNEPKSDSYLTMKSSLEDKMLGPKLAFFKFLAAEVEPFLKQFQDNKPLIPFLYTDLTNILENLMTIFVKEDVLNKHKNDVSKIDFQKSQNLIDAKKLNLGHETKMALREVAPTQNEILIFKQQCLKALTKMCMLLMNKSPLAFRLTKNLTFCDPRVIAFDGTIASKRLTRCLEIFLENKWLKGNEADSIEKEFKSLCQDTSKINAMKQYSRNKRLDSFWSEMLYQDKPLPDKSELFNLLKKVFVVSHGNSAVERGFSINKECQLENLSQQSLVAQRHVWEGINEQGGVHNMAINKEMVLYASNARSKYQESLEKSKEENLKSREEKIAKKRAAERILELTAKKKKLMEDAQLQAKLLEDEIKTLAK